MTRPQEYYDIFSRLLGYPGEGYARQVAEYKERVAARPDEAGGGADDAVIISLNAFFDGTVYLSLGEMEELYTRTFDINPVASLELGWHLYGEQYERGAFLVKMRQLLHQHFIEEAVELPDHLTHALLLLGRMERPDADQFAASYLLPSLNKILEGFAEVENPYKSLLQALKSFATQQHVSKGTPVPEGAARHD